MKVAKLKQDRRIERNRYDVTVTMPVSFATATLGGDIIVPTIDGKLQISIPEELHRTDVMVSMQSAT